MAHQHEPDGVIDFGATPSSAVALSGNTLIDAQVIGTSWDNPALTFSFPSISGDYGAGYPDDDPATPDILGTFSALSADQEAAAQYWFDQYASVSGLSFLELDGAPGAQDEDQEATIRMANSQDPGTAYGYYPSDFEQGGDIWFNTTGDNPDFADFDWVTSGHEIGHALGMAHGHQSSGDSGILPAAMNSSEYSIMTYNTYIGDFTGGNTTETFGSPQSLMMADIATIQYLYGANFNYNSSSTTYTFSTADGTMSINGVAQETPGANRVFRTIWDGNGGADHYDLSNYTTNLAIDLNPGEFSDFDVGGNFQRVDLDFFGAGGSGNQMARGHLFNALQFNGDNRSLIERATGGSGDDTIEGNAINNILRGGDGNDVINGNAGNDFIDGGNGLDIMDGGSGVDTVDYSVVGVSNFAITIDLQAGTWTSFIIVESITNFENVFGSNSAETILGTSGANLITGNGGNDVINARAGDDSVFAGGGDDLIIDSDFIFNTDLYDGGTGEDTLRHDRTWVSGVSFNLVTNEQTFSGNTYDTYASIENLEVGGSASMTGDGNDNVLTGLSSSASHGNVINGNGGDDTLNGGGGNDTLNGGFGEDTINGGDHDDQITGGSGIDTVDGGSGNDTIFFTPGNFWDNVDGGDGTDTIDATAINISNGVFDFQAGTISGFGGGTRTLANVEIFLGGNTTDDNIISDGTGAYFGNGGNDTITAGDTPFFFFETLDGGAGVDTLDTSDFNILNSLYAINLVTGVTNFAGESFVNFENLISGDTADTVTGTNSANIIITNGGNDTIDAGSGNDFVNGGDGDDYIDVGTGIDEAHGGAGDDTIRRASGSALQDEYYGGTGIDTIDATGLGFASAVVFDLGAGEMTLNGSLYSIFQDFENYDGSGGTGGEDVIGTAGANVITTGSGQNIIDGNGGNDTLSSGGGIDVVNGGGGDDTIDGGSQNDTLNGNGGTDTLNGGADDDILNGGAGNDNVNGDGGDDLIIDTDSLVNVDTYDGGTGNDTVRHDNSWAGSVAFSLATGEQTFGGVTYDTYTNIENLEVGGGASITGDSNDNVLTGLGAGAGDGNVIDGNSGNDTLNGGGGDDILGGGAGNDALNGGTQNDILNGGAGDDTLNGDNGNDILNGNAGVDNLNGGNNDDILNGGAGNDTVDGGSGNDLIIDTDSLANIDTYTGGFGNDTLRHDVNWAAGVTFNLATGQQTFGAGIYDSYASIENLEVGGRAAMTGSIFANILTALSANAAHGNNIDGGGGDDTINGGGGNDTINGDSGNDNIQGGTGNDTIDGGSNNDTLFGQSGDDIIAGGTGNDVLHGQAGIDQMDGGAGDDRLYADSADTVLQGGTGFDYVHALAGQALDFDVAAANVEWVWGHSGADILDASAATTRVVLHGRGNADILVTGSGDDTLIGGFADDTLTGGAGNDRLYGQTQNDTLNGGTGNDNLYGQQNDDILNGDTGADNLFGGTGDDILSGGGVDLDRDLFVFQTGGGTDTITDYEDGVDQIQFRAIAGTTQFSDLAIANNGSGDAVITYSEGTVTLNGIDQSQLDVSDFVF